MSNDRSVVPSVCSWSLVSRCDNYTAFKYGQNIVFVCNCVCACQKSNSVCDEAQLIAKAVFCAKESLEIKFRFKVIVQGEL